MFFVIKCKLKGDYIIIDVILVISFLNFLKNFNFELSVRNKQYTRQLSILNKYNLEF